MIRECVCGCRLLKKMLREERNYFNNKGERDDAR